MTKDLNRHILKEDKQVHEHVLNTVSHQGNSNQNHKDISSHTCYNGYYRKGLCTIDRNVNWYSHYGKQYGGSSKKLKTELVYDPVLPLLYIYLKEITLLPERDICTAMFTATLFTIAMIWKHRQMNGYRRCMCVKKMDVCMYDATWNESDRKRQILYDVTYIWNLKTTTNWWL